MSKHLQMRKRKQMRDRKKASFVIHILMIGSKDAELLRDFFPRLFMYWQSMGKVATILKFPNNQYKVGAFFSHLRI